MDLKTKVFATVTALVLAYCVLPPNLIAGENIISNGSFEKAQRSAPAGWTKQSWGGKGSLGYTKDAPKGKRSVWISSKEGADAGWSTGVRVKPFSTYRLSGRIKTEGVECLDGQGALFNIHNIQRVKTPAVTGTSTWRRVEVVFETGAQDTVQINCLFGGWGLAKGKAFYDDVKLELLSTKDFEPEVTIDTSKERQVLPKYIYSQFIEHLGRCIYGGIWAEMLEDRKFWYPVGEGKSPWKASGDPAGVSMIKGDESFAGKLTPQIKLSGGKPNGIIQKGLGLVGGKEYAGRAILAGSEEVCPIEVALVWGNGEKARQTVTVVHISESYRTIPFRFTAGKTTGQGALEITALGKGWFRVGTASIMPADNIHGMRPDTLKLLKQLNAPLYRWPGGNFVSGYDWKDGIGKRDKRPPRKNPAWKGVEHNDFGLDEFILFCREVQAEPLIVVNSGKGTVENAVKEVQYANGSTETEMGKLRAANGHPEPYNVKYWGIGNEMYGGWQLGHMPLEDYIKKHNRFAEALREVDSGIELVAVGAAGNWSKQMLTHCADHMDLISEHFYCQEKKGLLSHVRQIPNSIRAKAEAHRRYRKNIDALSGKDIRIAMDEWNYWYGPHIYGELGVRYHLKDALGIASGINEYSRNTDIIFMANYAQTVNVIGCIKTTKTEAAFAATGLVLKLYRHRYGNIPVRVAGDPFPLDVAAAWTEDRKALTVSVVNPMKEEIVLPVDIKGCSPRGPVRRWLITGKDPMAYNEPGKKPRVKIRETEMESIPREWKIPPISASIYRLQIR